MNSGVETKFSHVSQTLAQGQASAARCRGHKPLATRVLRNSELSH
jgi:hypothetical protein